MVFFLFLGGENKEEDVISSFICGNPFFIFYGLWNYFVKSVGGRELLLLLSLLDNGNELRF